MFEEACRYFRPAPGEPIRGCLFGNLALELSTEDPLIRQRVEQVFEMVTGYLAIAVQEAIDCGDLLAADPEQTAQELLAYLQGASLLAKVADDEEVMLRQAQAASCTTRPS